MATTAPHLLRHVQWYSDCNTFGGVLCERLLAALPLGGGLYCGLVFSFDNVGSPRLAFWERLEDPQKSGFTPIDALRARGWCDMLPRFLERLQDTVGS